MGPAVAESELRVLLQASSALPSRTGCCLSLHRQAPVTFCLLPDTGRRAGSLPNLLPVVPGKHWPSQASLLPFLHYSAFGDLGRDLQAFKFVTFPNGRWEVPSEQPILPISEVTVCKQY